MKYAWIAQQDAWPAEWMCNALGVSASGYAAWKRGGCCSKRLTDTQLLALIRTIHKESRGAYGAPRIWEEMKARGLPAGKERIRKLMQSNGIRARHKRRPSCQKLGMGCIGAAMGGCFTKSNLKHDVVSSM